MGLDLAPTLGAHLRVAPLRGDELLEAEKEGERFPLAPGHHVNEAIFCHHVVGEALAAVTPRLPALRHARVCIL
jgi:hypothetical protein